MARSYDVAQSIVNRRRATEEPLLGRIIFAMLTESEANRVWERMVEAEVRSLYYADLASRFTARKQVITGTSFFFSSGAAATLIGRLPTWVPAVLSVAGAIVTAYSIAVSLDRRIGALTKLHRQWNSLFADYERRWNHWSDAGAR